jgi:Flp pilus assembly protein TadD
MRNRAAPAGDAGIGYFCHFQPGVNLARALAMQGDYDQARQVCREALNINPNDRIARNLMATLSKYGKSKPKP